MRAGDGAGPAKQQLSHSISASPTIPLFKVFMAPPEELDEELLRVVHSGYVTQGLQVEAFEEELRAYFCNDRVLTMNSATSAIHLSLHLLRQPEGIWPGLRDNIDEVCALS